MSAHFFFGRFLLEVQAFVHIKAQCAVANLAHNRAWPRFINVKPVVEVQHEFAIIVLNTSRVFGVFQVGNRCAVMTVGLES